MATGPDCVGVGSNCSHIRKPPSLQSAAWIRLQIAFPRMHFEKTKREPCFFRAAGTFMQLSHRKYARNAPCWRSSSGTFGATAEYSRTERFLQLREFCLRLCSRFTPSPPSTAWRVWSTNYHADSNVALQKWCWCVHWRHMAPSVMWHQQCGFNVMTDSDFQNTPKYDLLYVLQRLARCKDFF